VAERRRALVTGGAGFIGAHLCGRLLGEGYSVICMDNLRTGAERNLVDFHDDPAFTFVETDVTTNIDVPGALDEVYHFASPASPADFERIPIPILKVGALGTYNCLGLAKDKGARLMLASTSEVYGDPLVHPQPEDYWGNVNPVGIRGVYDEAKRYAEAITMAYRRHHAVDTRIVRIFNTYGPLMRLDDGRMIPNFISQALRGEALTIYGDGSQTRSIQFVDDLVEGVRRLMNSDEPRPVNIGNPTEYSVTEVAQMILRLSQSSSSVVHEPLPADDPRQRCPDISRARDSLGWTPSISAEDGLQQTIAWFAERLATKRRS
jgi:dTDP-glucose 4,6-dehydratase